LPVIADERLAGREITLDAGQHDVAIVGRAALTRDRGPVMTLTPETVIRPQQARERRR
jgi:hypothetical protein